MNLRMKRCIFFSNQKLSLLPHPSLSGVLCLVYKIMFRGSGGSSYETSITHDDNHHHPAAYGPLSLPAEPKSMDLRGNEQNPRRTR